MNEYERILQRLTSAFHAEVAPGITRNPNPTDAALRDLLVILARRERELAESADRSVGG